MATPVVVVVQGPPAAGKTTVARELAALLHLPLIAKDTIKEALFDELGTGDPAWSARLGAATYLVLGALVDESAGTGASLVLEGNFVRGSELEAQLAALPTRIVQVYCSAPLELLLERYASRVRHAIWTTSGSTRCGRRSNRESTTRSSFPARRSESIRAAR